MELSFPNRRNGIAGLQEERKTYIQNKRKGDKMKSIPSTPNQ